MDDCGRETEAGCAFGRRVQKSTKGLFAAVTFQPKKGDLDDSDWAEAVD